MLIHPARGGRPSRPASSPATAPRPTAPHRLRRPCRRSNPLPPPPPPPPPASSAEASPTPWLRRPARGFASRTVSRRAPPFSVREFGSCGKKERRGGTSRPRDRLLLETNPHARPAPHACGHGRSSGSLTEPVRRLQVRRAHSRTSAGFARARRASAAARLRPLRAPVSGVATALVTTVSPQHLDSGAPSARPVPGRVRAMRGRHAGPRTLPRLGQGLPSTRAERGTCEIIPARRAHAAFSAASASRVLNGHFNTLDQDPCFTVSKITARVVSGRLDYNPTEGLTERRISPDLALR